MRREDREAELSPPLLPPRWSTLTQWGYPPLLLHHLTGSALGLFSLLLCPYLLVGGPVRLLPCHIVGQIAIPWFTAGAPKTILKAVSMMKR
jgi:hypothetical protein